MIKFKIVAIVVTFNRKELLIECLSALEKQTPLLNRIYLIDNGSNDGTYDYIHKKGVLHNNLIRYYNTKSNLGGAGGFNYGLKKAFKENFDWYWMMDDDSIVQKNTLEKLINSNSFKLDDIGVLNSAIIDINNQFINTQKLYNWQKGICEVVDLNTLKKHDEIEVDISSFVGFFIKKHIIEKIGYPNKEFFFQYDDNDYSLSIKKAGFKNILIFDSVIKHKINSTFDKNNQLKIRELWKFYYGERNRIFLGKKRVQGNFNKLLFLLYNFLRLVKHLLINFTLDRPILRNKIWLLAFYHAIIGKLGKTIDPVLFLKKLNQSN